MVASLALNFIMDWTGADTLIGCLMRLTPPNLDLRCIKCELLY